MTRPSMDRDRLARRNENRYRFLRSVFDSTGGNTRSWVNMWDVGEELGLSREETSEAEEYLQGEGLIDSLTLGGGIVITHAGVVEVEASIENPDEPTDHFTVQVITNYHAPVVHQHGSGNAANIGNTTHATIPNATVGSAAIGPGASASGDARDSAGGTIPRRRSTAP